MRENWEKFFGAVVLFDKKAFEHVNGYPNVYWGWGAEDEELGMRCALTGLGFDRRDGTYRALPHKHGGYSAPGVYTEEARRTLALFEARRQHILEFMKEDDLQALKFKIIKRLPIMFNGVELPNAIHYVVDIGMPESA
jgi:predicted glycosyltransferase involved in capsule biosynthesis